MPRKHLSVALRVTVLTQDEIHARQQKAKPKPPSQNKNNKAENDDFLHQSFETTDSTDVSMSLASSSTTMLSSFSAMSRCMPTSLVVGHEMIKQALVVSATTPACSILIEGRRGTCKSVLARSLHRLVPPTLRRIQDNPYNVDPNGHAVDSFLEQKMDAMDQSLSDLPTELIETPFVTVPLGVTEDALLGAVDLEQSLETGQTVFAPGLLAKAHRGILYIDEVNLLDDQVASLLFQALADGFVRVEREGLSVTYPCQPLAIATYNPAEGDLRDHLKDRFALHLSSDDAQLSVQDRVQAVFNVEAFTKSVQPSEADKAKALMEQVKQEEIELRNAIEQARDLFSKVKISKEQLLYLCETATRADCSGQRGEIYAALVARASAALAGRDHVVARDLELAVLLAIAPRGRFLLEEQIGDIAPPAPPPSPQSPPPPPPPMTQQPLPPDLNELDFDHSQEEDDDTQQDDQSKEQQMEDHEDEKDKADDEEEEEVEELQIPLEFMFGIDSAPIDPRLLKFNKRTRLGKGGKHSRKFNLVRGRFVKAIFPRGNQGRLAVGATLRAAAPYQLRRRQHIRKRGLRDCRKVFILKDDFRIKQLKRKTGNLVIFVVDASGSMALNRMAAAKGSAVALLEEAYKSRDKICLIACHGTAADVLVPPTKSVVLASKRLEALPCGSKTPLAHALTVALRTGLNTIKVKRDCGRVIIVLISDGRGNVPLSVSMGETPDHSLDSPLAPSRAVLKEEILAIAKQIRALEDFDVLCIDTEDKFVATGLANEIAKVSMGNYYHLRRADSGSILRAVETVTEQQGR